MEHHRLLTVYGRKPVMEALKDASLTVRKLHVSETARGVGDLLRAARARGVEIEKVRPERVARLSGNARQDQGVALDLAPAGFATLDEYLAKPWPERAQAGPLFVLDGVTTPANVGMTIRSVAAGGGATVIPAKGTAALGPLVVKASAGTIFRATVLRCGTPEDGVRALVEAGHTVIGLDAQARSALWDVDELPHPLAFVLGGESTGISPAVADLLHDRVKLPLAPDVESLNVACAATAVAFELARRRHGF